MDVPFAHMITGRVDERDAYNRILLTDDQGEVEAIEFFQVSNGIDLRGFQNEWKLWV